MVSGVAALVLAQHPELSAAQVAQRLEETAQDRGPTGVDVYYGHGLLDAYAALGGPVQAPDVPRRDALEPNDDGRSRDTAARRPRWRRSLPRATSTGTS